jgi:hypothetical protein
MPMIFFSVPESRTPLAMAMVAPPMYAPTSRDIAAADFGAVIKHHNGIDAQHGTLGDLHELVMQGFLLTILNQLAHQLETFIHVGARVQTLGVLNVKFAKQ